MASPRVINPIVQRPASRESRIVRSPSFPWMAQQRPWNLQPVGLYPVLPGETMTQCMVQFQGWTDPLKAVHKNTPWVLEMFLFYCKFRDLPGWEVGADGIGRDLIQMIETGEDIKTPHQEVAGRVITYCPPGGIDYTLNCVQRIAECYFREEGQAWSTGSADGLPLAHAFFGGRRDVMERLSVAAAGEDRRVATPAYLGGLTMQAYMDYAAMRNQAVGELQAMDYEDIVRSAGGRAVVRDQDREDLHVPELLGVIRHFDYPTNTVEPSTGTPSVAFGTRIKQALKQNYRFPEFGWIVPILCVRPKVLYMTQQGLFADMMSVRTDWFMASDDPNADTHWKTIPDGEGPLKTIMDANNLPYTVDLRNLLWHGEQFVNFGPAYAEGTFVNKPSADTGRDYVGPADVSALFVTPTTNEHFRSNGVIDLSIKTYPAVNPYLTQDDRQFSNRD